MGLFFILCLLFEQTKSLFQRWLFYGIGIPERRVGQDRRGSRRDLIVTSRRSLQTVAEKIVVLIASIQASLIQR
ncbi:hypothetical protein [Xanthomonas arboricola]|uniref:hypothetical protein n=1 Tax=Xanthomonas arboricola TaxID=56448 RepID=UPI0031846122